MNSLVICVLIYERSKIRCLEVYSRINFGLYIYDLLVLNLLDFIVELLNIDLFIGLCYRIVSENFWWVVIDKGLE